MLFRSGPLISGFVPAADDSVEIVISERAATECNNSFFIPSVYSSFLIIKKAPDMNMPVDVFMPRGANNLKQCHSPR